MNVVMFQTSTKETVTYFTSANLLVPVIRELVMKLRAVVAAVKVAVVAAVALLRSNLTRLTWVRNQPQKNGTQMVYMTFPHHVIVETNSS